MGAVSDNVARDQWNNTAECQPAGRTFENLESDFRAKPFVAVGTNDGVLVNQHLGEVRTFRIWEPVESGYILVDERTLPETAAELKDQTDWTGILNDCRAVLISGLGELPKQAFAEKGIAVIEMNGFVIMGLDAVFHGQETVLLRGRRHGCSKGGQCSGDGGGCGMK